MRTVVALAFVSLMVVGCGGGSSSVSSPSPMPNPSPAPAPAPTPAPAPPPSTVAQIGGTWLGSLTMTVNGQTGTLSTTSTLEQSDRTVTGSWRVTTANNDINGTISGTLNGVGTETAFSGTVTWSSETSTGTGRCIGRATFTGSAAPPVMRWTSQAFQIDNCSGPPTNIIWNQQR